MSSGQAVKFGHSDNKRASLTDDSNRLLLTEEHLRKSDQTLKSHHKVNDLKVMRFFGLEIYTQPRQSGHLKGLSVI